MGSCYYLCIAGLSLVRMCFESMSQVDPSCVARAKKGGGRKFAGYPTVLMCRSHARALRRNEGCDVKAWRLCVLSDADVNQF